jgi:hypothetical protein
MEYLTPQIAAALTALYAVATFLAKVIPDSETGFLGTVRKIAKFVSLYVQNNTK